MEKENWRRTGWPLTKITWNIAINTEEELLMIVGYHIFASAVVDMYWQVLLIAGRCVSMSLLCESMITVTFDSVWCSWTVFLCIVIVCYILFIFSNHSFMICKLFVAVVYAHCKRPLSGAFVANKWMNECPMSMLCQLPAYEFNFSDTNPPVHAWACLHVYENTAPRDIEFLRRCFHHLVTNFTWYHLLQRF